MPGENFKRKLAAILHADVEGYSRLIGGYEEATVSTLRTYQETMGLVIRKHQSLVVHGSGDSLLTEFASVVDAVRSAVEIQEEISSLSGVTHELQFARQHCRYQNSGQRP